MINPMTGTTDNPLCGGKIVGAGIDPSVYHGQEKLRGEAEYVMSRSELIIFGQCPTRWLSGYKEEDTASTEWGTLIDGMALDSSKFVERFAVAPEKYPSAGMQCPTCGSITDSKSCRKCKQDRVPVEIEKPWDWNATWCSDWRENHQGMIIIKHDHYAKANEAIHRLMSDDDLKDLWKWSDSQVMVIAQYNDKDTGLTIPVKVLIDGVPTPGNKYGKCLWDLKTAVNASAEGFAKAVYFNGYDVQAAMCLDAYTAAEAQDRTDFFFVVQENFEPWQHAKWIIPADWIEAGRLKYTTLLQRYARCLKSGHWPGFEDTGFTRGKWENWGILAPEAKFLEA